MEVEQDSAACLGKAAGGAACDTAFGANTGSARRVRPTGSECVGQVRPRCVCE